MPQSGSKLTAKERIGMRKFILAVEYLLALDAESVGHIADHVGEHGTDGDGGMGEDSIVVECLRVVVDNHHRAFRE